MAEGESGQPSMEIIVSDTDSEATNTETDIETINTEELVMFNSIETFYSNRKDLEVVYTKGNLVQNNLLDWIGLFGCGWNTITDYSAYQLVSTSDSAEATVGRRSAVFPQIDIQELFGDFQCMYLTASNQVLGVSDSFFLADFDPKSESTFVCNNERLAQSFSLISLGSVFSSASASSSSSEENQSVDEETFENIKASSEYFLSSSSSAEFQFVPIYTRQDCWSLSDSVVGNGPDAIREKLYFPETLDPKNAMDEYEPLKQFYVSLCANHKPLVEEVSDICDDPEPSANTRKELACTDLVLYDRASLKTLDLWYQALPVSVSMLSFWREHFQRCCLELYRRKLLESEKSTEHKTTWILPISNILVDNAAPAAVQKCVKSVPEVFDVFIPKQPVFSFRKRKPEDKIDSVKDTVTERPKSAVSNLGGGISRKQQQQAAKQVINLRKKRSAKMSKTKSERGKQEEMLKEALSLLSPHQTAPLSGSEKASSSSGKGKAHSGKPISRKRSIRVSQGTSKAKRRRLNGKKPLPNLDPCRVEDEGYFTTDDEEDGEGSVMIKDQSDNTIELLNLALSESLKNNADLRNQARECIKDKERINAASTNIKADTTAECVNSANAAGKAVNTEMTKTCTVASNTSKVPKKNTQSQCRKTKTSGKATNTEKKENRHASSNTASVPKKDSPSQCHKTKTSGASTNTVPALPRKDAEINTPAANKAKDSAIQFPIPDAVKVTKATEPETIKVDVVLKSLANTSSGGCLPTPSGSEINSEEWNEVASERMVRLRRLIAKKKKQFASLRENAENWEYKAHALEAKLSSLRSLLTAETIKRVNTEKDLRDLRTKFWELLAARKSQPWRTAEPSCRNAGALVTFSGLTPYPAVQPALDLPPVSVQRPRNTYPVELIFDDEMLLAPKTAVSEKEKKGENVETLGRNLPVCANNFQEMTFSTTTTTSGDAYQAVVRTESLQDTSKQEKESSKKSEIMVAEIIATSDALPPVSCYEFSTHEQPPQLGISKEEVPSRKSEVTVTDMVSMPDVLPLESKLHFKPVPLVSTSDYENIPQVNTSEFITTPAFIEQTKKAPTGAISFKRFLMPAMTALSETFRSSKPSCKAGVVVADEHTTTTTTQPLNTKASACPVAKVTMSFSAAGILPSSSSAKPRKSESKKRRKHGSRSTSRSSKERSERREVCKLPCQETAADSTAGESCAFQLNPSSLCEQVPLVEMKSFSLPAPSPRTGPVPVQESAAMSDRAKSEDESSKRSKAALGKTTTEWRPLTIPLDVRTGNAVSGGQGTATIGIEPVKFHFSRDLQTKSAGKGRSMNYVDVASVKLTRNLLAAELVAKAKYEAIEELTKEVSAAEDDVTHAYEDAQVDTSSESTTPPLLQPPPPSAVATAPSSKPVPLPLKRVISAFSTPSLASPQRPSPAVLMLRDLAVHQTKKAREPVHPQHQYQHQQAPPHRPPRTLHYDFMKAYSDVISGQIRKGKCLTCGMKFSPAVDRYLVEEHIHFHHAFAE